MFKKYLKLFNKEEFSYKIYSEFDKDEWSLFLKCFKDIFREIEQNMFQWYFDKNNTFTILKNDKEKFIGIYGLLEIKLNLSEKEIESYLCHNVGIMEQYSGKGLFQYIGDKALSNRLNDKNLENKVNEFIKVTSSKRRGMPTRAKSDNIISKKDNNVK